MDRVNNNSAPRFIESQSAGYYGLSGEIREGIKLIQEQQEVFITSLVLVLVGTILYTFTPLYKSKKEERDKIIEQNSNLVESLPPILLEIKQGRELLQHSLERLKQLEHRLEQHTDATEEICRELDRVRDDIRAMTSILQVLQSHNLR